MAILHAPSFEIPAPIQQLTNLADLRIGAKIIDCSDEFFAEAKRMLQFDAPIFVEDKFADHYRYWLAWRASDLMTVEEMSWSYYY